MKTLHRTALFCCLGMSHWGLAQTAQVHIAGSDYPVIFADTNLSFTVRKQIAYDLKTVFSPASSFEDVSGKEAMITVPLPGGGGEAGSYGRWAGVYEPSIFNTLLSAEMRTNVFFVDHNSEKSVRISKAASDRYQQAFALMKAHSNTVQKACAFIDLVKDPDLLTEPIEELRDLFHVTENGEPFPDKTIRKFLQSPIQRDNHPGLSVLHFAVETRPEVGNAEVLVMYFYLTRTHGEESLTFPYPVLYHNGRWGFGQFW